MAVLICALAIWVVRSVTSAKSRDRYRKSSVFGFLPGRSLRVVHPLSGGLVCETKLEFHTPISLQFLGLMAAEACLTVILSGSINAVTSAIHDRMPVTLDQEEGRQQESELAS